MNIWSKSSLKINLSSESLGQGVYVFPVTFRMGMSKVGNTIYNLRDLRLAPKPGTLSAIVNDEICMRVAAGKIKVRSGNFNYKVVISLVSVRLILNFMYTLV